MGKINVSDSWEDDDEATTVQPPTEIETTYPTVEGRKLNIDDLWDASDEPEEDTFWGGVGNTIGIGYDAVTGVIPQPVKDYAKGAGSLAMHGLHYLDIFGNPIRVLGEDQAKAIDWAQSMGWEATEPSWSPSGGTKFTRESSLVSGFPRVREDDYLAKIWGKSIVKGVKGIIDPLDPEGKVVRAQDWYSREYVEKHPVGSFFAGLGAEIALDPLTWTPGVVVSAPFRFVAHVLRKMGNTKTGQAALSNSLMQGLNVYVGDAAKVKDLARTLSNDIAAGDYFRTLASGQNSKTLDELAQQLGMTPDALHKHIIGQLEGFLPAQNILHWKRMASDPSYVMKQKEIDEWTSAYRDAWKKFLDEEVEAGVPITDLMKDYDFLNAATGDVMGYVPHVLTSLGKRGGVGRIRNFFDWFRLDKRRTGAARARKSRGTIAAQEAAAVASGRIKKGEKFFHTNPELLNAWRGMWHDRAMATTRLRDGMRQFGSTSGHPDNWVPIKYDYHTPEGIVKNAPLKNADGEELFFRPDVAEAFGRQQQLLSDPREMGRFLRSWDKAQNWWKLYALITRPAYYTRNVGGNFTNAYLLAGVANPIRYKDAAALQLKAFQVRAGKDIPVLGKGEWGNATVNLSPTGLDRGKSLPAEEVWNAFVMNGLYNRGQYGLHGDIPTRLEDLLFAAQKKGGFWKRVGKLVIPSSDNELAQLAFRVFGATPENNARAAVFINELSNLKAWELTGAAKQAAYKKASQKVRDTLFDYTDVSKFERDVAKRIFPFYKWSRNNIPAHLLGIMRRPDRYQKMNLAIENIQYGVDIPAPEDIDLWMRDRAPLYLSMDAAEDVYHIIPLLNWMPYADLSQLGTPRQMIEQMASPFLKLPMEYWANYDSFRKGDIKKYSGQTADFMGVQMPVYMRRFMTNLVFLAELDRGNPWEIFGANIPDESGKIHIKKMAYEPFFNQLHEWGLDEDVHELKIPGLPIKIGGQRETRRDFPSDTLSGSRGGRLLQFLTGLRSYQAKPSEQTTRRGITLEKDLSEAEGWLAKASEKQGGDSRKAKELRAFIVQLIEEFKEKRAMIERKRAYGKK